jgi:uridine kinase
MKPIVVGIAGGSGSGKSLFTARVVERLGRIATAVIPHDAYYHDIGRYGGAAPGTVNFDHPDALESGLLADHLLALKAGKHVERPVYDYAMHTRTPETVRVGPCELVIVEGILLFAEERLRDQMDLRVFVDVDADERLLRRIRRDVAERGRSVESVARQYLDTVKPMHRAFVEPGKRWADLIVPGGGENRKAVATVAAGIRAMLGESGRSAE